MSWLIFSTRVKSGKVFLKSRRPFPKEGSKIKFYFCKMLINVIQYKSSEVEKFEKC